MKILVPILALLSVVAGFASGEERGAKFLFDEQKTTVTS